MARTWRTRKERPKAMTLSAGPRAAEQLLQDLRNSLLRDSLRPSTILDHVHCAANDYLGDLCASTSFRPGMLAQSALADAAEDFHTSTGLITPEIRNQIRHLRKGTPPLVFAYQPNFLPSEATVAPLLLLGYVQRQLLTQGVQVVPIMLLVDYDAATDRRFGVAHIPTPSTRSGSISLRCGVSQAERRKLLMNVVPSPPGTTINYWRSSLRSLLSAVRGIRLRPATIELIEDVWRRNAEALIGTMASVLARSRNMVEFNAMLLITMLADAWEAPILFASGTAIHARSPAALRWIAEHSEAAVRGATEAISRLRRIGYQSTLHLRQNDALLWLLCPSCHTRVRLLRSNDSALSADHECNVRGRVSIRLSSADIGTMAHTILPTVLADDIIDVVGLGAVGTTGYANQTEHILVASYALERMGIQPIPHALFRGRSLGQGWVELAMIHALSTANVDSISRAARMILAGRGSIVYSLITNSVEEIGRSWRAHFANSDNLSAPNLHRLQGGDQTVLAAAMTHLGVVRP